jgi:6-phosphogluconolactonase
MKIHASSLAPAEVRVLPDTDALNRAAADEYLRAAREAILERGRFAVALAGGNTPRAIYEMLVTCPRARIGKLPWEKMHIFFGDERCVPPDHAESNFRMVKETLLSQRRIPAANVHRIRAEADAAQAAEEYETELRTFFAQGSSRVPRFDFVMLGLGPDGHTASLFPGSEALNEQTRLVVASWVPQLNSHRITLTLPVLNAAAEVLFVVSGKDKAEVVHAAVRGGRQAGPLPAQRVQPTSGRLLWLVDQAAASLL